jgi:acyl-[acyl-carrier-protein]-phospholipid O-acyltransferase/long-chain-fatty-acid--[acyl-carrier-protein] ligase
MIDMGEAAFQARPELNSHLARESFLALARFPRREQIIDCTQQRRSMKSGFLLAVSYVLSKRIAAWTNQSRVGVLFPPSLGGYIANLAVVLAGKVPVNLNFTLGPASASACIRQADIDCLLTTERVKQRMPKFPWPETGVVDMVDALKALPKAKTLATLAGIHLCPAKLLVKLLKIPSEGGDREAGLLFTSGSSGEPKGVVLSHRNILANCAQIDTTGLLPKTGKLLANLPIFHSFGFTVTLWYPLLRGCGVVTMPSPLEVKRIADVIEAESATVLVATPTFLKPYMKHVAPEKLRSLEYVVAGAEKSGADFVAQWESRFGSLYLEGYGLTETSPVVSISVPACARADSVNGCRSGSVGRMMPGQAARILDPDTLEDLDECRVGLLAVKGPNVFQGYLNNAAQTAAVKDGDWFITGDLARFDSDGFLYIEGRLSRFSKVGGEMVPHGTIEEALVSTYELGESELPLVAVAGRPDEAKGESLVLITAIDLELADVREKLIAAGLPNLWIPKQLKRVKAIPTLATGKLDLRAVSSLARG